MKRPVGRALPGRRLDLHPEKKLRNPARHLRALERWSSSLEGYFPGPGDFDGRGWWYEKIPTFQKVIEPPNTTLELQARAAQSMIDAASRIAEAKPAGGPKAQIYAFLCFPHLSQSMVEVALEPNGHLFFNGPQGAHGRHEFAGGWVETFPTEESLIDRLGLAVPERFEVRSIGMRTFEQDWMDAPFSSEEWVIGELGPG